MKKIKKLKLPVIHHGLPDPPPLSMDDYYRFVLENRRLFAREVQEQWEKGTPVNVRFVLKDS